jgi:hypothetical protein
MTGTYINKYQMDQAPPTPPFLMTGTYIRQYQLASLIELIIDMVDRAISIK